MRSPTALLLLLTSALVGCAGPAATTASDPPGEGCARRWGAEVGAADVPAAGWLVVDPTSGCVLDAVALDERLGAAEIVYVGESHDVAAHHAFQAEVVRRVAALGDGEVLVGFEMFNAGQQPVLDAWSRGELGTELAAFLEAVDWSSSWGMDASLYAAILELGLLPQVRLVGLNAPRAMSRRVFEVGLEGLEPEERAALPATFDDSDTAYRAFVMEALLAHGHGASVPDDDDPAWRAMQQRFFEAQLVWDESMAEHLVAALRAAPTGTRAVVVAGSGHVRNRWGIPQRVQRRLAQEDDGAVRDLVIVCATLDDAAAALDPARADLFCLTSPEP